MKAYLSSWVLMVPLLSESNKSKASFISVTSSKDNFSVTWSLILNSSTITYDFLVLFFDLGVLYMNK